MGAAALLAMLAIGTMWHRHRTSAHADNQPTAAAHQAMPGHEHKRPVKTKETDQPKPQASESQYDFYKLLPKFKMNVPSQAKEEPAKPAAKSPKAGAVATESTEPLLPKTGTYLVQTGSFRKHEQAERMKASLALLGVESVIRTVVVNGDQTYYRVQIGPLRDLQELANVQTKLRAHGYTPIVMRNTG
jgi:cell division protein FtsN